MVSNKMDDAEIAGLVAALEGLDTTTTAALPTAWAATESGAKVKAVMKRIGMVSLKSQGTGRSNQLRRLYHMLAASTATMGIAAAVSPPVNGKVVGFAVLPPAHGKSYLTSNNLLGPRVFEADKLVGPKSTVELANLRVMGRCYGQWAAYDRLWHGLLHEALPVGRSVVLVPSWEVGMAGSWWPVGTYLLDLDVWIANLSQRKGSVEKYALAYANARRAGGGIYPTNDALCEKLKGDITAFLSRET